MKIAIMKKALMNKRYGLPIAFLLFVFIFGIIYLVEQEIYKPKDLEKGLESGCLLEYGHWECINGKIAIPFYNAGEKTITYASIAIPVKTGYDIYATSEHLESKKTGVLLTANCEGVALENSKLKWCCAEDCFETYMNNPKKEISIKIQ